MDRTRGRSYSGDYRGRAFYKIDFSHASFKDADLDGTKFIKCILYDTNFIGSNITHRTKIDYTGMRSPLEAKAKFTNRQKALLKLRDRSLER